ncbi:MAG: TetR/AcrR family transcriptional regulator [Spirochaetaceae bacterium]|nr:TetR/AcrR family transcriptional regulator [Spirochaetaceae bacterium]
MKTSRERLMAIAFRLFLAKGYDNTTMADLVAASGLSKGAFHHYFPRKEDLWTACVEHFFLGFLPKPRDPAGKDEGARALLWSMAAEYGGLLELLDGEGIPVAAYYRFLLGLGEPWTAEMEGARRRSREALEAAWNLERARGGASPALQAPEWAHMAMSLLEGFGILLCAEAAAPAEDRRARLEELVEAFLRVTLGPEA